MKYKHLTIEERYQIQAYKKAGYKQKEMAKEIGVSDSTISRELKRNSSPIHKRYSAKSADNVAIDKRRYAVNFTNMFPPVSQTCFHLFHSKFPLGNRV